MPEHRILLIEDESTIADTLGFVLERDGMQVQWCALAHQGEAALSAGGVDLVVLDVGLPDANGFDVLKRIRRSSEVPVIMLTARGEEMDRVLGLELGADDYVVKPFSPREVAARVKAVLKRRSALTPAGSAPAHGFWHDEAMHRVALDTQWMTLTPTEYKILSALLQGSGRVLSRAQLLDAFDGSSEVYERTIDSHIKALRAKIRLIRPDFDPIETHRGFGYSLRWT